MKTYLWTIWNSNRLLKAWLQVNSVTGARHALYADWLQPFEVCVTESSIYFHSGWLYRCSVTLWLDNEWEVLMVTSPLLNNVRQKAMLTPVSPVLATLVHISPSYWTNYRSFEITVFPKWELSAGLDFISNVLPGVGKLVKWKSFLQKTKNTSEPQNQFVMSI